ncbi:MAG TPA: bifunctional nuclease family protein [Mycobacteriales bacterium]|nr:bifunctional nuclease family protein [Mycobacteriales bacterium]
MRQVEIAGLALEASSGSPVVVLRETEAPHRVLPIFVGGSEATAIGLALAGETPSRPLTYDLMATLMQSLDAHLDRVEVTEVRDGAFLAEVEVTVPSGGRRLDTRPSDAIALAVRLNAPLFVSDAVLDEAGAVLPDQPTPVDPAAIDEQVAAFRSELDTLDPADFGTDDDDGAAIN